VPKILVADPSAPFQEFLSKVITPDWDVQIVGRVRDGMDVAQAVQDSSPDLLLLDIFMPPNDGLVLLDRIMRKNPLPVILFSSLGCPVESELFQEGYDRGAQMVLAKPKTLAELEAMSGQLNELITRLAGIPKEKLLINYIAARRKALERQLDWAARKAVGIISSTGAVEVLRDLLLQLPQKLPAGVLVAQHMYAPVWKNFTTSLASKITRPIKMAHGGEVVREGHILLSPTEQTLLLQKTHYGRVSRLETVKAFDKWQIPLQPHLDAFLASLAESFGKNAVAIVLSGMGEGGVDGSRAIRELGGEVWVQDPSTAKLPSMPEAVIKAGLATKICDPAQLSSELTRLAAEADR
jgi:two-component system chemotaxis response regulator CheB